MLLVLHIRLRALHPRVKEYPLSVSRNLVTQSKRELVLDRELRTCQVSDQMENLRLTAAKNPQI